MHKRYPFEAVAGVSPTLRLAKLDSVSTMDELDIEALQRVYFSDDTMKPHIVCFSFFFPYAN